MGVDSKEYHPVMSHKGREAGASPLPTDVGQNKEFCWEIPTDSSEHAN